jgi:nucleotide-binding universal stress UspA family protein
MLPVRKLLVPTDFSEPSYRGVKAADELAREFGAEMILIHVVSSTQPLPFSGAQIPGFQLSTLLEKQIDTARRAIRNMIREKISEGISSRPFVLSGAPAEDIVRVAADQKVDAIVIATHGSTGWRRFFFGSVAERVVRLAECPVLSIPGGEENE